MYGLLAYIEELKRVAVSRSVIANWRRDYCRGRVRTIGHFITVRGAAGPVNRLTVDGHRKYAMAYLRRRFAPPQEVFEEMAKIRIDTRSLTYTSFTLLERAGWVDGVDAPAMDLKPGQYHFQQASGIVSFDFAVSQNGAVDYPSENDRFLRGRGSGTLVVQGFPVTLDARKLSHGLQLQIYKAGMLSRETAHELILAPGSDYMFLAGSGIVPDFAFTLGKDGRLSIDSRYDGFAKADGRTLTISGCTITISGLQLSHALQPADLFECAPVLSQDQTHELTLIPAPRYLFHSAPGIYASFVFALGIDGNVRIDPSYGNFSAVNGHTLTVNGYRVVLDGTSLPYDLKPAVLGWTGGFLSNTSTHEIRLIPADAYQIEARGSVVPPYTLKIGIGGVVAVHPKGLLALVASILAEGSPRDYQVTLGADDSVYRSDVSKWCTGKGYRIVDLAGYETALRGSGTASFAAIFQQSHNGGPGFQGSAHFMPPQEWRDFHDKNNAAGWQIIRDHGFTVNNEQFFSSIYDWIGFDPDANPPQKWCIYDNVHDEPRPAQWSDIENDARAKNFRIIDLDGNTVWWSIPGVDVCVQKTDGRDWTVTVSPIDQYQGIFDAKVRDGYRPVRVYGAFGHDAALGADVQYIFALWEKNDGRFFIARHAINGAQFVSEDKTARQQNYRLTCLGAYSVGRGGGAVPWHTAVWERRDAVPVVDTLANQFMNYYQVPGMAMAISRSGKLVYANGYGLADQQNRIPASAQTLWRIASVSKAITAVAVLLLVQQKKVKLTDHVFGPTGLLGGHYVSPTDRRVESVTVSHLLHHTSGGWPSEEKYAKNDPDPMYMYPSWNQHDLITWVLETRSLHSDPGSTYMYSNFGYCVLGRVIEQVTGQPYDAYVKANVLAPCGISDMVIAGNTISDRLPGEAIYYGEGQDNPYDIPVRRMDSHGGWVGSVLDMLRFANRVDGHRPGKILAPQLISYMSAPSGILNPDGGDEHYACGWWIFPDKGAISDWEPDSDWQANGNFAGTCATLARANDDFCMAAVINTWKHRVSDMNTNTWLQRLVWEIYDQVDLWTNGPDI